MISLLVAYAVLRWMLSASSVRLALDHPNERSLHTKPVPRTGGIALMAGTLAGWSILWPSWLVPAFISVTMLMLISLIDDVAGLAARWRFFVHLMAAAMFLLLVPSLLLPALWLILIGLAMVWMTNLYNFMDGSDGLAGGMAVFGFGSYALAAWMAGDRALILVNLSLVMAALAFLRFNFHPASIFMGDAGSIPLGFLSAALGLIGWQRGLWPLWFPLMVFSPFVVDASATLVSRLLRGEKVWQAHREHYYQRLVQMGWGHRRTALAEYLLMLGVGMGSVLALQWTVRWQMAFCLGWMLAYWLAMKTIDRRWAAYLQRKHAES